MKKIKKTARERRAEAIGVHIRWMIRRDIPEMLQIEEVSFDYPWCEEDFFRTLRQKNCIGMVAEAGERVVGFMIYELHKAKIHLLNFAVRPDYRRRGVGRQMVEKLMGKLSSYRRTRLTIDVRETNLEAQFFFRACGLRAIGVWRGFYEDSGEDAYMMEYRLESTTNEEGFAPANRISQFLVH